ncbi:diphosphate--fructose-6-phosphate 1-phosphotransferase [Candidatus Caldatribacterium saccharofermentans]|uniref:diphosphate--fructose-6-phosphate 1-phosphotransferase n=1 Tax=Candidatus Caldatribacterium saccharofermentans TaxID=1454753 RepID=UPI0017628F49
MSTKRLAILVGGGPAPGINGVIGSVTIAARKRGLEVVGFYDGFKWISSSSFDPAVHTVPLDISRVSRIHLEGGSILRTARDSLIKGGAIDEAKVANVRKVMESLNVGYLVTIGGDDTAFSASIVARAMEGRLFVAHVPKTIDNDLPLPGDMPTFGFQTAREVATSIVKNLMEDARTTNRWYFVVIMGRSAGHLALGTGKAAGATLTIIPEEFGDRKVRVEDVCDIIEAAMIKRKALGRDDGIAIVAEGVALKFGDVEEIERILGKSIPRDPHGHVRLAEVPLGELLKNEITRRFEERGKKITIVTKDVGYELRCAPPIPFDIEYTRDLGYGAVEYLLSGSYSEEMKRKGAMISILNGKLNPIPFDEIMDPVTGRTRVRTVDITSYAYQVARSYMIRLEREDLENPEFVASMAKAANMDVESFTKRFGHLVS